jgi:hypothetical protein
VAESEAGEKGKGMTTQELIEELRRADPDGEAELRIEGPFMGDTRYQARLIEVEFQSGILWRDGKNRVVIDVEWDSRGES